MVAIAKCDQCKQIKETRKVLLDRKKVPSSVNIYKHLCDKCRAELWEIIC